MQYNFNKLANGLSFIGMILLAPFIVAMFIIVAILYIVIALLWVAGSETLYFLSKKLSTNEVQK